MDKLDNLVKINKLKLESPNQIEFDGLVRSGVVRLHDAKNTDLSDDSRFDLAYNAAHSFALAAMRWHGYRSDNRYLVFQCLQHTLALPATKCRVLDVCHNKRNLAEYEGHLEIDEQLLTELIDIACELQTLVQQMKPIK